MPDLPGSLRLTSAFPFAGRTAELETLRTLMPTAERGGRRVVLLTEVTRNRPALLVREDGHWADGPSLMLLRHLTRAAGHARLLMLATFRDTEADVPEALSETLADLRRSDDVVRMRLGGLSGGDVAEFVRSAAGGDLGPELRELAEVVHDLTKGNAFLVCELWRTFVETGAVELAGGTV